MKILLNGLGPNVTYHCQTENKTCKDGDTIECTDQEAELIKALGFGALYDPDLETRTKNLLLRAQNKRQKITEKVKGGK